jgi:hypothetical protein
MGVQRFILAFQCGDGISRLSTTHQRRRMKTGRLLKKKLASVGLLLERYERYKDRNDAISEDIKKRVDEEKKAYNDYLEGLPRSFSREYNESDYRKDISNVELYYTKWKREDMYDSKGSLKRIRRYESRYRLEPFEEANEKDRKIKELARLTEVAARSTEV